MSQYKNEPTALKKKMQSQNLSMVINSAWKSLKFNLKLKLPRKTIKSKRYDFLLIQILN